MALKQIAYKYPCYPNKQQEQQLNIEFNAARAVYNWGLATRKGVYQKKGRSLTYMSKPDGLQKRLTLLKQNPDKYWPEHMGDTGWLKNASLQCLQNKLRDLDSAFMHFFRRLKRNEKPGYPKFKIKGRSNDSVRYNIAHCNYDPNTQRLWLCKQSEKNGFPPLKIKWDRPLPSYPKSCTVSRDSIGQYYIAFTVTMDIEKLPPNGKKVGIDLGVKSVIVTDEGYQSGNPKNTERYAKQLKKLQRQLRLKKKGSKNREKQKLRIAKLHRKIRHSRNHFLHVESKKIILKSDVIAMETLNVKGMLKNKKLSKRIADAGIYEFYRQLEYKADMYGREILKVNQWYPSSKTCSNCGYVYQNLALSERKWKCSECLVVHDRDVNAAKNILHHAITGS